MKIRKCHFWVTCMMIASVQSFAVSPETNFELRYGQILSRYWHAPVEINGVMTTVFNYEKMSEEANKPNSHFQKAQKALAIVSPEQLFKGNRGKAFWINAYNFAAKKLVVDYYPIESIRDFKVSLIKYPWSKKTLKIGKKTYSLKEIEHDVLLKHFDDPRVVFAVSCAAVSCPDRTREPFTADKLEKQLDELMKVFFQNAEKGLKIVRKTKTIWLSWILKKDKHLFEKKTGGVLGFVQKYISDADREWLRKNSGRIKIKYLNHDWTLNDLALGKKPAPQEKNAGKGI